MHLVEKAAAMRTEQCLVFILLSGNGEAERVLRECEIHIRMARRRWATCGRFCRGTISPYNCCSIVTLQNLKTSHCRGISWHPPVPLKSFRGISYRPRFESRNAIFMELQCSVTLTIIEVTSGPSSGCVARACWSVMLDPWPVCQALSNSIQHEHSSRGTKCCLLEQLDKTHQIGE